jgi:CMP-N,N'-diacetyllegionaminic acid synthase
MTVDDLKMPRSGMKTLAFIPARAGSKGIKGKNLRHVGDKTLIQWAIQAAKLTGGIDHIVLSTDIPMTDISDVEIYPRPLHLADGLSYTIVDVVLDYLNTNAETYNLVALFQPTSPFVRPHQVEELIETLSLYDGGLTYSSAQTVCLVPHNYHAFNQRQLYNGPNAMFYFPDLRRDKHKKQDKPVLYKFGNMVVTRVSGLKPGGTMFTAPSWSYVVGWKDAIDIDTPDDLELANLLYGMEML